MHCVIIGAGWAGLAAAVELGHRGHQVTLLDSARQSGGRARHVSFGPTRVDNGQHLLIGAYSKTLELLQRINILESDVLERLPLQLLMHHPVNTLITTNSADINIQVGRLPAPLHMLKALLFASGLSLKDRMLALRLCAALPLLSIADATDISLQDLLQRHRQSDRLIECLWEPLCLATMNTPPAIASASVFVRVLRDAFLHRRSDCDFLIPRVDLSQVIPEPAIAMIESHGGNVQMNTRIDSLVLSGSRVDAVITQGGNHIKGDHFILALPPYSTIRLLQDFSLFNATTSQLSRFQYAPIATVYLQYPVDTQLSSAVIGVTGCITQWVFDRRLCGQPGLMAVVISGNGLHEQLSTRQLAATIETEMHSLFPDWPDLLWTRVIREKRATFLCHTGINSCRPGPQTAATNLWLAGDYTNTCYPATLEGAVRSGYNSVSAIQASNK